jgi:hypothetical protein
MRHILLHSFGKLFISSLIRRYLICLQIECKCFLVLFRSCNPCIICTIWQLWCKFHWCFNAVLSWAIQLRWRCAWLCHRCTESRLFIRTILRFLCCWSFPSFIYGCLRRCSWITIHRRDSRSRLRLLPEPSLPKSVRASKFHAYFPLCLPTCLYFVKIRNYIIYDSCSQNIAN